MSAGASVCEVTRCRSCRGSALVTIVDLGEQPACDDFPPAGSEPEGDGRWPLGLRWCPDCALVQLSHTSPGPETPLATTSRTALDHALHMASALRQAVGAQEGATVREFGSAHGGHWLNALVQEGFSPTEGPADLVIDNHGLIHDEDLDAALAARVAALDDDGVFAIEFHHVLAQMAGRQVDTIRHGHPVYLSLTAWQHACRRHGLVVVDAWEEQVYGGCLVVLARRGDEATPRAARVEAVLARERAAQLDREEGYDHWGEVVTSVRAAVLEHLRAARASGRSVLGYGAGSKAVTFLGVTGVDASLLPVVADASPAKAGHRIGGTAIEVVPPAELLARDPDEVLLLTWDIADEVTRQLRRAGLTRADLVVALPELRWVSGGS